jgi:hypothetical protein
MSAYNPPDPYFNGINYNNAFFSIQSNFITLTYATKTFLNKITGGIISGFVSIIYSATGSPQLLIQNTNASSQSSLLMNNNDNTKGMVVGIGNTNSSAYQNQAFIEAGVSTSLILNADGYTSTPKVLIDPAGNVGIGTGTTTQKLTVNNGALQIIGASVNPGNATSASFWNQALVGPTISGANIAFNISGTTEAMRILANGNVGIGTNNPATATKLNVNGVIKANDYSGTFSSVALNPGTNWLGFVDFFNTSGARCGYIGWGGNLANYLDLQNENGYLGYRTSANLIVTSQLGVGNGTAAAISGTNVLTVTGNSYLNGTVGIGTNSSLTNLLEVNGGITSQSGFSYFGGTGVTGLRLGKNDIFTSTANAGGLNIWTQNTGQTINLGYFGGNGTILSVANTGVTISQQLITTTVGIGTNSPSSILDVYGTNPKLTVRSASDAQNSILYLGTPNSSNSALKCAFIAEALTSFSRSKLHICLNNTADNSSTFTAGIADACFTVDYNANCGVANTNPINSASGDFNLCVGNSSMTSNNGTIIIGKKTTGTSTRQFRIGLNILFDWCIGDYGNNNTAGSWIYQLGMAYQAPLSTIYGNSIGQVYVIYNPIATSDIKVKTDIRTIDNALWKVQQLRGVYYKSIIDETENIGLIAQETEYIIPEAVRYNEHTDTKGISYGNLTALLINAIKEQQEIIDKQEKQIENIMYILSRNSLI